MLLYYIMNTLDNKENQEGGIPKLIRNKYCFNITLKLFCFLINLKKKILC